MGRGGILKKKLGKELRIKKEQKGKNNQSNKSHPEKFLGFGSWESSQGRCPGRFHPPQQDPAPS